MTGNQSSCLGLQTCTGNNVAMRTRMDSTTVNLCEVGYRKLGPIPIFSREPILHCLLTVTTQRTRPLTISFVAAFLRQPFYSPNMSKSCFVCVWIWHNIENWNKYVCPWKLSNIVRVFSFVLINLNLLLNPTKIFVDHGTEVWVTRNGTQKSVHY